METREAILKRYAANIANLLAESSKEVPWEVKATWCP
jgi:hypothetical protein